MQADVQAGQQLLERWGTRNEAIAQLEAVIEDVSGPVASQVSPGRGKEGAFCPYCCAAQSSQIVQKFANPSQAGTREQSLVFVS